MVGWRLNLILIFLILFGTAILGRLIYLQILQVDYWRALAQGQQKFFEKVKGERGEIFITDREGNLYTLATNKKESLVFVSPKEIEKKEEVSKILAEILELDFEEVFQKLKKNSFYEVIKKNLTSKKVEKLKAQKIKGVYLGKETKRHYPYQNFASHLLGFVGGEGRGQYGLEEYYHHFLEGKEEFLVGEKIWGTLNFSQIFSEKKGYDLYLTIDYNLQNLAEELLRKANQTLAIEGGQIIVMDPQTGKILALANFPSYDPNHYSQYHLEIFKNDAIHQIFEPGSVFKPVVMAAGLNEGKITPQTSYQDRGFIKIGAHTIYNYEKRVWGWRTMTEVLEKSINTGAVFCQKKLGGELFLKYLERFELDKKTGIDLPGEAISDIKNLYQKREINFATASFGQGVALSPIKLLQIFAAIANGGKLVQPYLVEKIKKNEKEIKIEPKILKKEIISPVTSSQLTAMLISVVKHGFAKAAQVEGYFIAGKTGTAQIPWSALGRDLAGYSEKTIQSFVGFFPAFDPQFVILVKLDNPQTKTAEYSAVPLFRELAKYIIDYYQIPPSFQ
jgi:cell division protein FtsI (penicillin-binding protein 3)/stage V sporulation protein D (sporulation-specific penicillin-binding protein)